MKVYSFKRSGTHYLMASLWLNYHLPGEPETVTPGDALQWHAMDDVTGDGNGSARVPFAHLFGSHRMADGVKGMDRSRAVYIHRDPVACITSLYRCQWERPRHTYKWALSQAVNHAEHVSSYEREGVYMVKYEDLHNGWIVTLDTIGRRFGLMKRRPYWEPPPNPVGWVHINPAVSAEDRETIRRAVREVYG